MSMFSSPVSAKNRSPLLDCIRAFAITLVLVFHVASRYDPADLDMVAQFFRWIGSKGVDIFFPLSGYLISRFLLAQTSPDFIRTFFLRRFFRIVPLYFVAVTLALLGMVAFKYELYLLNRIWINYTFLTAWFIFADGVDSVPYTLTWSLSVEEFAYVIFGVLAWVSRRNLPFMLVLFSILPALLRLYMFEADYGAMYFLPLARIDSIAIGGVIAWLMMRSASRLLLWIPGVFAICYVVGQVSPGVWYTLSYTMVSLGTVFFIVLFETRLKSTTNPVIRFFGAIGFYSYFTYLFHFFNIELLLKLSHLILGHAPLFWPMAVASLALTHFQAVMSYRFFEGPIMRFGRGLEGRRRALSTSS